MKSINVNVKIQESGTGHYFHYKVIEILDNNLPQFIQDYLNNWESNTCEWDVRFESGEIQTFSMNLVIDDNNEIIECGW